MTPERGTACGKVILLGEHAVVYGVPAIAVGIDRGARADSRSAEKNSLFVRGWNIEVTPDGDTDLSRAFGALCAASSITGARVEAEADLPPGGGLGCSAALGVAIARALDPSANVETVIRRAMAWEEVFHGNPSGVDAAVAAHGGALWFEKGVALEPIHLKSDLVLCVGHSGVASSTKSMVEAVARQKARRPEIVHKTFEGIASLVRNARLSIEAGDVIGLGKLMDLGQMLLSGLFLSTPEIEKMCELARDAGALGAKLTGAGGGGAVVALATSVGSAERVIDAWRENGFTSFVAKVAADGATRARSFSTENAP